MQLLLMKHKTEVHTLICMSSLLCFSDVDRMFKVRKLLDRYQQNVRNREIAVLINTLLMYSTVEINLCRSILLLFSTDIFVKQVIK